MDDKMSKVVKRVVKELESALKTEKKPKQLDNLANPPDISSFDGATGTPEDYISCYLSGQIPEDEWQQIITKDQNVMEAWNGYWTTRNKENALQKIDLYCRGQIPEDEWQWLLDSSLDLKSCWEDYKAINIKETEVMADNAVRTTFEEIIEVVLAHEGGFVDDPDDKGGATNWGVTQAVWEDFLEDEFTSEDVKGFTREQAIELYEEEFWIPSQAEKLPAEVREVYFDMCVNHGQRNAVKILQTCVNSKGGNLEVDGGIGPNTIGACSDLKLWEVQVERSGFYWNLVFKGSFYGKRNNQAKFIRGWIRRCFNLE